MTDALNRGSLMSYAGLPKDLQNLERLAWGYSLGNLKTKPMKFSPEYWVKLYVMSLPDQFGRLNTEEERVKQSKQSIRTRRNQASRKDFASALEQIEEIWESVPKEELDKLPEDSAENLDLYLYGKPQ